MRIAVFNYRRLDFVMIGQCAYILLRYLLVAGIRLIAGLLVNTVARPQGHIFVFDRAAFVNNRIG